jgi:hypothetical protein
MSEFEVQSGKHMLTLSSSQFDPNRTFRRIASELAAQSQLKRRVTEPSQLSSQASDDLLTLARRAAPWRL